MAFIYLVLQSSSCVVFKGRTDRIYRACANIFETEKLKVHELLKDQIAMYNSEAKPSRGFGTRWIDYLVRAMGRLVETFGLYVPHLKDVISKTTKIKGSSNITREAFPANRCNIAVAVRFHHGHTYLPRRFLHGHTYLPRCFLHGHTYLPRCFLHGHTYLPRRFLHGHTYLPRCFLHGYT